MLLGNTTIDLNDADIIRLDLNSQSKGNQIKYYNQRTHQYIKEQFYYQGMLWKDSYVEHLSYRLAQMTDTLGVDVIKQDVVTLSNGRMACVSDDFTYGKNVEWISIYRLLNGAIPKSDKGAFKVFNELVNKVSNYVNRDDFLDYLVVMIIFDYLLGNEDRHYNNFGLLRDCGTCEYFISPLFDFGLGLFEHDLRYVDKDLTSVVRIMEGKPFSSDLSKPVQMLLNIGLKDKVSRVVNGIKVPNRNIFPSELGYNYFCYAISNLREMLNNGN